MVRKLLICAVAFGSICSRIAYCETWGIGQIYRAALNVDLVGRVAEAQRDVALAREHQAVAALRPLVSASLSAESAAYYENYIIASQRSSLQVRPITRGSIGFRAVQPLYRPALRVSLAQANVQSEAALLGALVSQEDLVIRVAEAHLQALVQHGVLRQIDAHREALSKQLEVVKGRLRYGVAAQIDVLEAQTRLDAVNAQHARQLASVDASQQILGLLAGAGPIVPREISFLLTQIDFRSPRYWELLAIDRSTSIRRAALGEQNSKLELKKAEYLRMPVADLEISYNASLNPGSSPGSADRFSTRELRVGVSVNIPIFSSFGVTAAIAERQAQLTSAALQRQEAQRTTAREIAEYWGTGSGALHAARQLEVAEADARRSWTQYESAYKTGVRTIVDLLNAQAQYFVVRRDLTVAKYDALIAFLRLRKSAGCLSADAMESEDRLLQTC